MLIRDKAVNRLSSDFSRKAIDQFQEAVRANSDAVLAFLDDSLGE